MKKLQKSLCLLVLLLKFLFCAKFLPQLAHSESSPVVNALLELLTSPSKLIANLGNLCAQFP
jgi:hypothetical protein